MTIRTALSALACLVAGWLAIVALVTVVSDTAPASLVLFPGDDLLRRLSADTAILNRTAFSLTVASDTSGLAMSLYRKGAWLVLPAGLKGCS